MQNITDIEFNIEESRRRDAVVLEQMRQQLYEHSIAIQVQKKPDIQSAFHFDYMGLWVEGSIVEVLDAR